jgi:hypothetical protein
LCVPGFQQKNFDTIVKGTMEAIVMANNNMQTAWMMPLCCKRIG